MSNALGRVLIIAGSDSGGGAGLQADLKAVTALGGFAATAVTALTVQNTLGVSGVLPTPVDFVTAQARAVLDDIGADALKTGMLGDAAMVETVAAILDSAPGGPAVVDPVMTAKGGAALLAAEAAANRANEPPPAPTVPAAAAAAEVRIPVRFSCYCAPFHFVAPCWCFRTG